MASISQRGKINIRYINEGGDEQNSVLGSLCGVNMRMHLLLQRQLNSTIETFHLMEAPRARSSSITKLQPTFARKPTVQFIAYPILTYIQSAHLPSKQTPRLPPTPINQTNLHQPDPSALILYMLLNIQNITAAFIPSPLPHIPFPATFLLSDTANRS